MGLANTVPLHFSPVSASDALDTSDVFPGAMQALADLIPDPTTRNLWTCRPASVLITDFTGSGINTPAFVSCRKLLGTRVYGLIASNDNPGHDFPFCYDMATGAFVAVTGATPVNTPVSPATAGAWTPPTMDLIGTKLVVTHPGFNGTGGNYFGWFDVSNPAAPTWNGGNMTGAITFTTAPSAVKNFNGRAYFCINPPTGTPSLVFSDVLAATVATNANQALTFDDNQPLTALAGLPLSSQLGGVVQALIVFKGVFNIYQVTGDAALNTLSKNALNVATGSNAPMTVCVTPKGLAFMAPDGVRIIDYSARVSDPLGVGGMGISVPFTAALVPSRAVAACLGDVMSISVQNGNALGSPQQNWWYHFSRGCWSGPHSFIAATAEEYNNSFVISAQGVNAKLFRMDTIPSGTSTYVENGTQMNWSYWTAMLPDTDDMCEHAMNEATLHMTLVSGAQAVSVFALDQNNAVLGQVSLQASGSATIWGAFTWGAASWQGSASGLSPQRLSWAAPIVFQRMSIRAIGQSIGGQQIGRLHMRYEKLGFLQNP